MSCLRNGHVALSVFGVQGDHRATDIIHPMCYFVGRSGYLIINTRYDYCERRIVAVCVQKYNGVSKNIAYQITNKMIYRTFGGAKMPIKAKCAKIDLLTNIYIYSVGMPEIQMQCSISSISVSTSAII